MNVNRTVREGTSPAPRRPTQDKPAVARTNSTELFRGADLLLIEHYGETYTLRQTRQGKLILNK
jgi:hemin uptake protein HemP